jgi:hypothetical protein
MLSYSLAFTKDIILPQLWKDKDEIIVSKCTVVSDFQQYRNLEVDFLMSSPSMKKATFWGRNTVPPAVSCILGLETLIEVLLKIRVFRYTKNSRQYVMLHLAHLHGHPICVCVCVCVLLLNPVKDLPFFSPSNMIDVGSGLDVSSFIYMSICGQTV